MGTLISDTPRRHRPWRWLLLVLALLCAGTLAFGTMRGRLHGARLSDLTPIPPPSQVDVDMPLQGSFTKPPVDGGGGDAPATSSGPDGPAPFPRDWGDGNLVGADGFTGTEAWPLAEFATANDSFPREGSPFRFAAFEGPPFMGARSGSGGFEGGSGGGFGGTSGGGGGGSGGGDTSNGSSDGGSNGPTSGPIDGSGSTPGLPGLPGLAGTPGQSGSSGGENAILMPVTTVPEPATWLALVTGFAVVGAVLRARRGAARTRAA